MHHCQTHRKEIQIYFLFLKYIGPGSSLVSWYQTDKSSHLMCVRPHRNPEGSSKAKVCELDVTLKVYKEILGFQVPVKDAVWMAVGNSAEKLVHVALKIHRGVGEVGGLMHGFALVLLKMYLNLSRFTQVKKQREKLIYFWTPLPLNFNIALKDGSKWEYILCNYIRIYM